MHCFKCFFTMGYYWAMKQNEIMPFVATWLDLEIIILSKVSQKEKDKYHSSVQFSHSVVSNALQPHGLQHAKLPCPWPTPRAYSNSCPSSQWCHPIISSSVVPFSSCLQSFPESGSFPVSQFFTSGGQSIGGSASASVLLMNIQDWFPLGWTGWISLGYHLCMLSKIWHKCTYLQNRNRFTDREQACGASREGCRGGMEWEFAIWRCKFLWIEWINNKVLLYSTGNYSQHPVINHNGKE